jgi:HNH endonuclease
LRELVECNPELGLVIRKHDTYTGRYHNLLVGKAGDLIHGCVDGIMIPNYHIVWVFATNGVWSKDKLDHKDGNTKNNKKSNLREATTSQNGMNKRFLSTNTSGVTGVCWDSYYSKWTAYVKINGKNKNLGRFTDFDKACQVRWDAEDEYFGEVARRHNRPRAPMKSLF